ncbi:MAG: polysaccharide biosynthesis tyrosine autokinase [Ruminococcus flavefaciens]|nr:polysaccharide biosynthesis tyrosine autokinase [Ruminococcus flavefaciens]MCM1229937.1 polysaccharide biosynthesis tyrosine autokinase [Ruminococcus flavefaciens]
MNDNTISIVDILKLMISKIWLIILLCIIGGIGAFAFSHYLQPLKYESYTTMYVKNSNKILSEDYVDSGDLNTAKSLVSTYIAILKSDSMMREVGETLISDFGEERISKVFSVSRGQVSESSLKNCLSMGSVDNTEVMRISATTTDAEISAAVCQTIARLAPDFLIRVVGAGSVETIDIAQINYNAVSPNVPKNTAIGALAGILIAALIIFLIDFFDTTVKSSEILTEKFDKPILGEINDIEEISKKGSENHYLITDPSTPFYVTEAFKTLRTNLIFSISTSDKKVIAVSSSLPGEGKSTLSSNIAIALSQLENNKVLLIDADMRKPVQHVTFGLKNKVGLSSALGKMNQVSECVQNTGIDNLDIITAGSQPPNPAELLSSPQMKDVLDELSGSYDYIIIDTPPVNIVSDPLSMGSFISGLVIAVKYASTAFDDIAEVVKKMELSDTKLLGFTMTRVKNKHRKGYYRKKYKSKYGYDYGYSYGYGYGYGYGKPVKSEKNDKD